MSICKQWRLYLTRPICLGRFYSLDSLQTKLVADKDSQSHLWMGSSCMIPLTEEAHKHDMLRYGCRGRSKFED